MSASLASVLHKALSALDGAENFLKNNPTDPAMAQALIEVKEEFRDDFRRIVTDLDCSNLSLAFLVYWENDEICREAVKSLLSPVADEAQKVVDALRAVADWQPAKD